MTLESVLLVPVPEAEGLVSQWRQRYDPSAGAGVPAHITVLYPFIPPSSIGPTELRALSELFGSVTKTKFLLVEVRRFEDAGVIYLSPEPASFFVNLTVAVGERFPDWPPYAGQFPEILPHLTVTQGAARDVLDEIESDIGAALSIPCQATEVMLMTGSNARGWHVRNRWALS